MQRTYRIGQIVPSSNTTMETEIPAMLRAREAVAPERFTFHSSRMRSVASGESSTPRPGPWWRQHGGRPKNPMTS